MPTVTRPPFTDAAPRTRRLAAASSPREVYRRDRWRPSARRWFWQTRPMAPTTGRTAETTADPLAAGVAGALLVRGGGLRIVAYLGAISTSIVAVPFLTRHLHSGDYGRYGVVTTLMLIVTALTEGGVATLGVRQFAVAPPEERREFMRNLLGIRIALSLLGGAAAIAFALAAGYETVEVEGTAIAAVGLVLANLQVTLTVPLTASLRLGWLAATDFIGPAVTATMLVVLVALGAPLLPFYIAAVAAYAVDLALTAALVRGQVSLLPSFALRRWVSLLRESIVFAAATALTSVYFQVVVVAMSLVASAHQTGIFFLAFRILGTVNGIPVVVVASAFPVLLRAAGDDLERLRAALGLLLEGSLLLGGWLSMTLIALAPVAVRLLGGTHFAASTPVLRILGAGVIASFLGIAFATTLLSLGAYRLMTIASVAMIGLAIALCAVLVPSDGARGAAVVTVSMEAVLACLYGAILAVTHPEVRPRLALAGRIALALAIGYGAAIAPPLAPVPAALAGTGALAIAVVVLRAFPVEFLRVLREAGS